MDKFYSLGNDAGMFTEEQIGQKLGNIPNQAFQYLQAQNLVNMLQTHTKVFKILVNSR